MLTPHAMCWQDSSYVYHTEWIIHRYLISTMPLLFKNYSLAGVIYLLTRFNKSKFILWNTCNTDGKDVNTQHTHTHTHTHTPNTQKDNTGKS